MFHDFSYFWNIRRIYSFFYVIFLKIFPIIFFCWKIIPSQLYLFIKGLTFVILCRFFFISSWFNANVGPCWKYLSFYWWDLLLLFFLLSNLDYLSMIRHDSDLCYDIYNILTEHNRKQSHYLLSIPNYFDTYFLVKQNVFL